MRQGIFFLLSLILTCNSLAQNNYSEPLQLNRNFLVHSAGLPQGYLLFVQDSATQVLFNPARANNFSTDFIYVNYLADNNSYSLYLVNNIQFGPIVIGGPGSLQKRNSFNYPTIYRDSFTSSKNPTFSAAALINTGGAKWLIELTNGLNRYHNLDNLNKSEDVTYFLPISSEFSEENKIQDYSDDAMTTSLKISRIFQTAKTKFSVGIFGIINKNNENSLINDEHSDYRLTTFSDGGEYRSIDITNNNQNGYTNNSRYVIGLEFTIDRKFWDYLFSVDYQFGDNSMELFTKDNSISYDSTHYPGELWNVSGSKRLTTNDNHTSQEPSFVNINNYFRHLINLITPEDNVFLSLNVFFSSGEISYLNKYDYLYTSYSGQITSGDTSRTLNSDSFNVKNLGVTLSTGYALSKSFSDLFVLSGLRFSGNLEHLENFDVTYNDSFLPVFAKNKTNPRSVAFTIPIYLNYTAAQWFSVYGGLNYSYMYSRYKYEYNSTEYNHNLISGTGVDKTTNNGGYINQGWQSYKSIYLGCELKHSSGIKLQFFFDDDFTYIRNWNVSVGYHF